MPGNPYDGQTLSEGLCQVETSRVPLTGTRWRRIPMLEKVLRRRNASVPRTDELKADDRLVPLQA